MYLINIQCIVEKSSVPKRSLMREWAKKALSKKIPSAEVTIRIVDTEEMTTHNFTYRNKNGPTNVLSFPFDPPKDIPFDVPILGDILICAEVVNREAQQQNKLPAAHWAHMIIHGIFHLLGYDHVTDQDAKIMEAMEVEVLQSLGFNDPYQMGEE